MSNNETAALPALNRDNEEAYKEDAWYAATAAPRLGWCRLSYALYSKLLANLVGYEPYAPSLEATEAMSIEFMKSTWDARLFTRVGKKGKDYTVSIPVVNEDMSYASRLAPNILYEYNARTAAEAAERLIPGITDADASIDITLPLSRLQTGFDAATLGFDDNEEYNDLINSILSVRFVSPPCRRKLEKNVAAQTVDRWAAGTGDTWSDRAYLKGLMESRTAVIFFEMKVSAAAAEHICQGTPKLSLLGEYFIQMCNWLFGNVKDYMHNVVPITQIAAANAASGVVPVSRTDENGLSVNAKGAVLWMPNVNNSEFIEAEVEEGGKMPDGQWTRLDCVDPEANEYQVVPGPGGRNVRQRRPRGRNRLIYTDWHNSRLSYTDDEGALQLLDLSMFRKANSQQLAALLNTNLTTPDGKSANSHLQFAVDRGVNSGIRVAMDMAWFSPYFTDSEAADLLGKLNGGKLGAYLEDLTDRILRIHSTGIGARQFTPDEMNALDLNLKRWLVLDLISATSPIPMLRPVAAILSQTFDKVMADPASVFGHHSVRTTLQEIATLLVVSRYASKYAELKADDELRRENYLNPKLLPINEIEVKDIPFVSGNVELFPHQVKAWNHLRNSPENVVLDVAAGGGKTLLALLDIAYQIGRGMRRPLVICPGNLIRNYVNDALWLFAGKMNMVVLNGTTFNSKEWGEERLVDLANNAPPNTIFLTDYDFIVPKSGSKRMVNTMYGTSSIRISLNNEFLKRIVWGGVWMDESHLTKNSNGSTNQELMRLISTIDYKRQLSGTYISDNLRDVVGQFALINPQTFGEMSDFEDEYYLDGSPKPGAQRMIRRAMDESANVVTIRRKEWAALLPRRLDQFHPVEMSPAQALVYSHILEAQKKELDERIAKNAELKAVLGGKDEEGNDIDVDALIENELGFMFQRLEQFITAPASDEMGRALQGTDRLSPKLAEVVRLVNEHINQRIPGKILVWTQYVESAAAIYRTLPEPLKSKFILYTAATQDQAMAEFQNNPKLIAMIGCEKSMNTGHNLQYCSRIIRLQTVWNWGTLEQGESRINRPRADDPRKHENGGHGIIYDWVFCNKSVDVTKNSRMISKLISTIKFYEQNNSNYQQLGIVDGVDLPPVRLSRDNILTVNDWEDEDPQKGCRAYFLAYEQYQQLEQREFDEFVNNPANRIEPYTLEEGHIIDGAGLLKQVPYIPQMNLYQQTQLGLIPLVEYMSSNYSDKAKTVLLADDESWSPEGLKIHTEYGDCVARGFNRGRKSIRVVTPDGTTVSVETTVAWVITKEQASGREIREAMMLRAGAEEQIVTPTKVKVVPTKKVVDTEVVKTGGKRAPTDNAAPGFEVFLDTYDSYLALVVGNDDPDVKPSLPVLDSIGFIDIPAYNYTRVKNFRVLRAWIDAVSAKVTIHSQFLTDLETQYETWKKGKTMEKFASGLAASSRKRFLTEQKVVIPKGTIKPYLVVHNDEVFLCLNAKVNAATMPAVRRIAVSGIQWKVAENEHWFFARSKQEVQTALTTLFKSCTITNREELVKDLAAARIVKVV